VSQLVAAEHIPHVERAYVSGGATGVVDSPQHFAVTIDNYGKTPAFIGTIWANIVPENEFARDPSFTIRQNLGGSAVKRET
jgi:hypothetical protein